MGTMLSRSDVGLERFRTWEGKRRASPASQVSSVLVLSSFPGLLVRFLMVHSLALQVRFVYQDHRCHCYVRLVHLCPFLHTRIVFVALLDLFVTRTAF
jgi:hypothetical protein